MESLNILGVLVAAASAFLIGGLWYSPKMFLNTWLKESGVQPKERHGPTPFIVSFVFALIASALFDLYVPHPDISTALSFAFVIGAGWVGTSFGINYQFGGKSVKLLLIDAGYHIVQFLLIGLILGAWSQYG